MNRRNTIIIAVLVNAGLLLVLFATAMRSGNKKEEPAVKLAEAPIAPKEATSTPVTTEELLNEYIASSTNSDQEEVIVLDDLVNGTTTISPSSEQVVSNVTAAPMPASSMPALQAPSVSDSQAPLAATNSLANEAKPLAPKATQPVSQPGKVVTEVVVKKGDYLEKIAKANNTTVNAIMQANHLSSTNLKIGQVLKMPEKSSSKPKAQDASDPSVQNKDFYIVKEGDSPWLIASKCNVKLDELLRINNIDEQKAKRLRPGDKLRIR